MKRFIVVLAALSVQVVTMAQDTKQGKTEVLLLGSFHFANPGLDVAKFDNADILSPKRQKEIAEVLAKLKAFKPDKIFIEVPSSFQNRYDSLLAAYKNGSHILTASEAQQIGFRLATECGLSTINCVNYMDTGFPMDSVTKVMMANRQVDMLQYLQTTIQTTQNEFNASLKTKTIHQLLLDGNTDKEYDKLAGIYYFFLKAGDKNNYIGAWLASEQWRRNMYIYANILKSLDGKEQRILVLYGTTHVAMLKEMMKYNEALTIVPVSKVL